MPRESDYIPCYSVRVTGIGEEKSLEEIRKIIEDARLKYKRGFATFSVTERDSAHKKWLKIIQEEYWHQHGARIMETQSRLHGDYPCWMIMVPYGGK